MDPVTMMVGQALYGAGKGYFARKKAKEQLAMAREQTPEEREYQQKLTELAKKGDPDINKIRNRRISAIRQVGEGTQQKITGDIIQSGMENSVVASELRRKAGSDVMRQVSTESAKLAEKNRKFKREAESKLDKYNLDRGSYLKKLSMQEANLPSDIELAMGGASSIIEPVMAQQLDTSQLISQFRGLSEENQGLAMEKMDFNQIMTILQGLS